MHSEEITAFYGSLSPASNLLNCVITLERSTEDARITVKPGRITIKTQKNTKNFDFLDLKLYPETCRGLKYSPTKELHFSMKAELTTGNLEPALPQFSNQSDTVDGIKFEQHRWFCGTCKQKIISDGCIFSRVLPLPSENWLDYADMWFCHNHGHGDSRKGQRLLPKLRECLVGETFVLIDKQHLKKGMVKFVRGEDVVCSRCGRQLGSLVDADTDKVKLFLHTIAIGAADNLVDEDTVATASISRTDQAEELFARLFLEQSQAYTSYRFIVETKQQSSSLSSSVSSSSSISSSSPSSSSDSATSGVTSTCLVWLLDGNSCMFRSESTGDTQTVHQESVVSILFKCQLESAHSKSDPITKSLISLWKKDNTVHGITLPHPVFVQLVSTLVTNCKDLPRSQRFVNGFHVSFLRRKLMSK